MEISTKRVEKLFKDLNVEFIQLDLTDLQKSNSLNIKDGELNFKNRLTKDYLAELIGKNIEEIHLCINEELLAYLRKTYPEDYSLPQFSETCVQVRKRLGNNKKMNEFSQKQRMLTLKQDILARHGNNSTVLFRYNDQIDNKMLDKIEQKFGVDYKFEYSYRENGVLIFVNDPIKNIMLKVDITALFSYHSFPIYYAGSVEEGMKLYKTIYPKLCVFTNIDKVADSKELFLTLLEYDPFLKFLNYNESPSKNRNEENKRINILYNDSYDEAVINYLEAKAVKRPNLDGKMRNPIMDKLEQLRENYSRTYFYELKYYLYRMSEKYNVTTLQNILDKIKK